MPPEAAHVLAKCLANCGKPIEHGDMVVEIKVGQYDARKEKLVSEYRAIGDGFVHMSCCEALLP